MAVGEAGCLDAAFAQSMDRLGPFEFAPALTAAVSGGADSMALAVLARNWVVRHGGTLRALVVDHGLRPASTEEARLTICRLDSLGITASLLTLTQLGRGTALAERARIMRYAMLASACQSVGSLHLLVGHHGLDQAETVIMRVLRGSQSHGLAAMAGVTEFAGIRLLRPLLGIQPEELRQYLTARRIEWIEDPSNQDVRALRGRLRNRRAAHARNEDAAWLNAAADRAGYVRAREEVETAAELARRATIRPEGYAVLSLGRIGPVSLARLLQTVGGIAYAPSLAQVSDLAAAPRPATLAGVRVLPAGRLGSGLLLVREEARIAAPEAARLDQLWDGRFRLIMRGTPPAGITIGKLGASARLWARQSPLPMAVLRTLPAIWFGRNLAAVPHLDYEAGKFPVRIKLLFSPRNPMAGSCFMPGSSTAVRTACLPTCAGSGVSGFSEPS